MDVRDPKVIFGLLAAGGVLTAAAFARPGRYFTWAELTTTTKPYDNTPPLWARLNLIQLTRRLLDPIRAEVVQGSVTVDSGYRSPKVNQAVGGVSTSEHLQGLAADIIPSTMSVEELIARLYSRTDLPIGQAIVYPNNGFVHVSYDPNNRREFMESPRARDYNIWTP